MHTKNYLVNALAIENAVINAVEQTHSQFPRHKALLITLFGSAI